MNIQRRVIHLFICIWSCSAVADFWHFAGATADPPAVLPQLQRAAGNVQPGDRPLPDDPGPAQEDGRRPGEWYRGEGHPLDSMRAPENSLQVKNV